MGALLYTALIFSEFLVAWPNLWRLHAGVGLQLLVSSTNELNDFRGQLRVWGY